MEELGGHRDHALAVGLRRSDDQQRDDLATGPLVSPDAQVGQLAQLLDMDAGVQDVSTAAQSQKVVSSSAAMWTISPLS